MLKGTKLYSIFMGKCPQCQEGNFFNGNFFKGTPNVECSHCKLKFEREPGFFQGSYYVTYALGVATIVTISVATVVLFPEASLDTYLIASVVSILCLSPFLYPLSKLIWANFFIPYKPELVDNK